MSAPERRRSGVGEDGAANLPTRRVERNYPQAPRSAPPVAAQAAPAEPRAPVSTAPTRVADRPIDGATMSTSLLLFAVIGVTALGVIGIVLSAGHRGRSF